MSPLIVIVNIASGDPEILNVKTVHTIRDGGRLILRTSRTPLVSWLEQEKIAYSSLDDFYDKVEDFDQLSSSIVDFLWSAANLSPVVYAVADWMTDSTVSLLFHSRPADGQLTVIPGVGLSDLYQSSARSVLSGSDLRTVSATAFLSGPYDPNSSVLITELDNPILASEIKLRLSSYLDDESKVVYLHDQDSLDLMMLYELDRLPHIDHLSAVLIPGSGYLTRNHFVLQDLLRIMDRLRAPDGCPWDKVQTHLSLRPYMIEEAWECVAAIDQNNPDHLADELGDLLFQIVFHSSIGSDFDEFNMTDVINSICRKMIHRHPHVFGNHASSSDAAPSVAEWEKLKRSETGSKSITESLDDVSPALPALKYATKILKKSSLLTTTGRSTKEILTDIRRLNNSLDKPASLSDETLMGNALLLYAELCFSLNLDGELLLHNAVTKFKNSLQSSENHLNNPASTD
jgi:tetrapyrrole methylase family protein/MazG family protein